MARRKKDRKSVVSISPKTAKANASDRFGEFTQKIIRRYRHVPGYDFFYDLVYHQLNQKGDVRVVGPGTTCNRFITQYYQKFYLSVNSSASRRMICAREEGGVFRPALGDSPKDGQATFIYERVNALTQRLFHRAPTPEFAVDEESVGQRESVEMMHRREHTENRETVRDMLESGNWPMARLRRARQLSGRGLSGRFDQKDETPPDVYEEAQISGSALEYGQAAGLPRARSMYPVASTLLHREAPREFRERENIQERERHEKKTVTTNKIVTTQTETVFQEIINDDQKMKKIGNYFFQMFEEKMSLELERRGIS